jgi:hypothetical protein
MQPVKFLQVIMICSMILVGGYSIVIGDIPHLINYQGKLTDDEGNPLTGNYDLNFKIYNAPSGGDKRWEENHLSVLVTDGVFSVILGSQSGGIQLDFSEAYWLEVMVGTETISPRRQLTSVGYSYRAQKADTAEYVING